MLGQVRYAQIGGDMGSHSRGKPSYYGAKHENPKSSEVVK